MRWIFYAVAALVLVGCASLGVLGEYASDDPGLAERPGTFQGRFLSVSDADMTATAYADGVLERFEGAEDSIVLFENGAPVADAAAPNSVISWPQIIDISPDGRTAYVVETRGTPPADVDEVENTYTDFPEGRLLSVFEIGPQSVCQVASVGDVGLNPQSVEVSPDGRFLAIATESDGAELTIVPLDAAGQPGMPRFIDLDPPYRPEDREKRIRTLHVSPDGQRIAVNVGNVRVQFYEFTFDEAGLPIGVIATGDPIDVGVRLAVGRWTHNGRFFVVTDVNGYESALAMLTQRGGQVHVIAPPSGETPARLVDSARVGRFAEGVEISDDGTRIASVAMERTYLPNIPVLAVWPKRRLYTLTLLSIDPETGMLDTLDDIQLAGVLPEDVIFDETGRNLAVATFHRRKGPDRLRGFIDFFTITGDGQLESQGVTQPVMRGAHDLVRLL